MENKARLDVRYRTVTFSGESSVLSGHRHWVRCVTPLADGRAVSGCHSFNLTLKAALTPRHLRSEDTDLRVWDCPSGEVSGLS